MPIFGEKPFTSITVKINQLCTPNRNPDLEDESIELYVDDLISLIKLQPSGAVEAARGIRKKIKYGNTPEESILALNLLEVLVLNAGSKIGQTLASDDRLCDLLRSIVIGSARSGLGTPYDPSVIRKARNLSIGWRTELEDLSGYKNLATLWRFVPKSKSHAAPSHSRQSSASKHGDFAIGSPRTSHHRSVSPEESESSLTGRKSPPPPRPKTMSPYAMNTTSHKANSGSKKTKGKRKKKGVLYADEKYKIPQINYKQEEPRIRAAIADCHTHTTALDNSLLALPPGSNPLDNKKCGKEFEECRKVRRKILRYLQYVGAGDSSHKTKEILALDEEFLGSLIVANEQLVSTFQKYDRLCGFTPENPASYHEEEESSSSEESYYSSDSSEDESLSNRVDDMKIREASSKLEAVTADTKKPTAPTPPAVSADDLPSTTGTTRESISSEHSALKHPKITRQDTAVSTASGDPFGDSHAVGEGRYS